MAGRRVISGQYQPSSSQVRSCSVSRCQPGEAASIHGTDCLAEKCRSRSALAGASTARGARPASTTRRPASSARIVTVRASARSDRSRSTTTGSPAGTFFNSSTSSTRWRSAKLLVRRNAATAGISHSTTACALTVLGLDAVGGCSVSPGGSSR